MYEVEMKIPNTELSDLTQSQKDTLITDMKSIYSTSLNIPLSRISVTLSSGSVVITVKILRGGEQNQKLKILALHGGGSNGEQFEKQKGMQDLISSTDNRFTYYFPSSTLTGGVWWDNPEPKDATITQKHAQQSIAVSYTHLRAHET